MKRRRILLLVAAVFVGGAGFFAGAVTTARGMLPERLLGRQDPADGASAAPSRPPGNFEAAPADGLLGLAYLDGLPDANSEQSGVLVHHREASWPGVNLYAPRTRPLARLIDMDGTVLHEWSHGEEGWQHVHVFPDGGLLAVVEDHELIRLDRNSKLLWALEGRFHHDFHVAKDGTIRALFRRPVERPEFHSTIPLVLDEILTISPDGEILDRVAAVDLFLDSPWRTLLPPTRGLTAMGDKSHPEIDLLHTNHVEVFDGSLAELSPLFRAGNLLLSFRTISSIAIVGGDTGRIEWLWGPGTLVYQHHPSLLPNGNLLVFNNRTESSEVLEMNPRTGQVEWRYGPGPRFFSRFRGSADRLPNGNTLITESDRGYVHEVDPEGRTVWRFAGPDFTEKGERSAIWRMTRMPREALPFLSE